jgi:hypothetical protein
MKHFRAKDKGKFMQDSTSLHRTNHAACPKLLRACVKRAIPHISSESEGNCQHDAQKSALDIPCLLRFVLVAESTGSALRTHRQRGIVQLAITVP